VTRIVNAILIDDARLDETAQLKDMMPISPVSSDARRLEAKHCPDLAGAQTSHQPFEPGPYNRAASREAEIFVNDIDNSETMTTRGLHEIVLAALTLKVARTCAGEDWRT